MARLIERLVYPSGLGADNCIVILTGGAAADSGNLYIDRYVLLPQSEHVDACRISPDAQADIDVLWPELANQARLHAANLAAQHFKHWSGSHAVRFEPLLEPEMTALYRCGGIPRAHLVWLVNKTPDDDLRALARRVRQPSVLQSAPIEN